MNLRAIMFIGVGLTFSVGATSWWVGSDMQDVQARRAARAKRCETLLAQQRAQQPPPSDHVTASPATAAPAPATAPAAAPGADDCATASAAATSAAAGSPDATAQAQIQAQVPAAPDGLTPSPQPGVVQPTPAPAPAADAADGGIMA